MTHLIKSSWLICFISFSLYLQKYSRFEQWHCDETLRELKPPNIEIRNVMFLIVLSTCSNLFYFFSDTIFRDVNSDLENIVTMAGYFLSIFINNIIGSEHSEVTLSSLSKLLQWTAAIFRNLRLDFLVNYSTMKSERSNVILFENSIASFSNSSL